MVARVAEQQKPDMCVGAEHARMRALVMILVCSLDLMGDVACLGPIHTVISVHFVLCGVPHLTCGDACVRFASIYYVLWQNFKPALPTSGGEYCGAVANLQPCLCIVYILNCLLCCLFRV